MSHGDAHCDRCPCPATCLRWPGFCRWAAEDPPDETKLRHIRERSALGPGPLARPAVDYGEAPPAAARGCCNGAAAQ